MNVTPSIVQHEFIGTTAKVVKSRNSNYIGISGKVTDETRNTFTIFHEGKHKKIVKEVAVFHFRLSDRTVVEIDGRLLVGRPEDRLKKHIRRLW